ncbi:MAG: PIG-L family deacetylase [Flavobacteriales bacterium]|nr:PIG-L family deacetylase [Flavobacteriales bacterium]
MSRTVDILCITAHPDDVEISMAGTVLHHRSLGHTVGLVELTAGELGTRGSATIRKQEAEAARLVLGADFRYQLDLPDGFLWADETSLLKVVTAIRTPSACAAHQCHSGHATPRSWARCRVGGRGQFS